MDDLTDIKLLIGNDQVDRAILALNTLISVEGEQNDEAFYLLGNAYRKLGNWQMALNNYLHAIELNPDSPAVEAHRILMDILEFYHKDNYNQ
jgi:tetratricopeptide (TPR) repeat protein